MINKIAVTGALPFHEKSNWTGSSSCVSVGLTRLNSLLPFCTKYYYRCSSKIFTMYFLVLRVDWD